MTITQARIDALRKAAETIIEKYGGPDYSIRMTARDALGLIARSDAARKIAHELALQLSDRGDGSLSKGARDALTELFAALDGDDA